jgi:tryptophanase
MSGADHEGEDDPALELAARTLAEPFRIKVVERVRLPPRRERERILRNAFYSVMYLNSGDVFIDLGTDSGTGAMSDAQWGALMQGDEAYVRSRSFAAFERTVREVTGYEHVIPTHQGRGAENILMELLVRPGDMVLGNAHFDTTRAHIEHRDALAVDLVGDWLWRFDEEHPFKGNVDLEKLSVALERYRDRVPFIALTITNNLACSSPVSSRTSAPCGSLPNATVSRSISTRAASPRTPTLSRSASPDRATARSRTLPARSSRTATDAG